MSVQRAVRRSVAAVFRPLAGVAFPGSCWVTGEAIEPQDLGLSAGVRQTIARSLLWPYCRRCGSTVGRHANRDECGQCAERKLGLITIARVGTYEEPLAGLVRKLKFSRHWEIASVVGAFLHQAIGMQLSEVDGLKVDALVPVALHWRRRFIRGFNQAEELAREVSRFSGWPVINALRRVRPTPQQTLTMSARQRRENLRGAFVCVDTTRLAGKQVWLIDDVCTTGATLHAAAAALARLPRDLRPVGVHAAVLCATARVPVPDPALQD